VSFQNQFLTGHFGEWARPHVLTGQSADWAGPSGPTVHTSDWAGKQVAVKLQRYMTPSYFIRCSRLEGPNYSKKEEFYYYSGSLILRNSVSNGERKLLSNKTNDVLEQASEI